MIPINFEGIWQHPSNMRSNAVPVKGGGGRDGRVRDTPLLHTWIQSENFERESFDTESCEMKVKVSRVSCPPQYLATLITWNEMNSFLFSIPKAWLAQLRPSSSWLSTAVLLMLFTNPISQCRCRWFTVIVIWKYYTQHVKISDTQLVNIYYSLFTNRVHLCQFVSGVTRVTRVIFAWKLTNYCVFLDWSLCVGGYCSTGEILASEEAREGADHQL